MGCNQSQDSRAICALPAPRSVLDVLGQEISLEQDGLSDYPNQKGFCLKKEAGKIEVLKREQREEFIQETKAILVPQNVNLTNNSHNYILEVKMNDKRTRHNIKSASTGFKANLLTEVSAFASGERDFVSSEGTATLQLSLSRPTCTATLQQPQSFLSKCHADTFICEVIGGIEVSADVTLTTGQMRDQVGGQARVGVAIATGGAQASVGACSIKEEGPIVSDIKFVGLDLEAGKVRGKPILDVVDYIEKTVQSRIQDSNLWRPLYVDVCPSEKFSLKRKFLELRSTLENIPVTSMLKESNCFEDDIIKHISDGYKCILIVGDSGAGKSSLCSAIDGSLRFDDKAKMWTSTFKLGHGGDSETNRVQAGVVREHRLVLIDTPGLGDSRGEKKDKQHLTSIADVVNALPHIHGLLICLSPAVRISKPMRDTFEMLQKLFGSEMWDHSAFVVNKWKYTHDATVDRAEGRIQSEEQYKSSYNQMLQLPRKENTVEVNDEHVGLGLTPMQCKKLRFIFLDTHYRREDSAEAARAEPQTQNLVRWIQARELWAFKARPPMSDALAEFLKACMARSMEELCKALALADVASCRDVPEDVLVKIRSEVDEYEKPLVHEVESCRKNLETTCDYGAAKAFSEAMQRVSNRSVKDHTNLFLHVSALLNDEPEHSSTLTPSEKDLMFRLRKYIAEEKNRLSLEDERKNLEFKLETEKKKKQQALVVDIFSKANISDASGAIAWVERNHVVTIQEMLKGLEGLIREVGMPSTSAERLRTEIHEGCLQIFLGEAVSSSSELKHKIDQCSQATTSTLHVAMQHFTKKALEEAVGSATHSSQITSALLAAKKVCSGKELYDSAERLIRQKVAEEEAEKKRQEIEREAEKARREQERENRKIEMENRRWDAAERAARPDSRTGVVTMRDPFTQQVLSQCNQTGNWNVAQTCETTGGWR